MKLQRKHAQDKHNYTELSIITHKYEKKEDEAIKILPLLVLSSLRGVFVFVLCLFYKVKNSSFLWHIWT